MKNPIIIAGLVAIVALAAIAFALSASGNDDEPRAQDPTQPTAGPETPIPSEPPFTVTPADPGADPQLPPDRVAEAAPIDGLDVRIAESFPPQYFLAVVSGLPNSCVRLEGYEVARDGNDVVVTVTNRVPAPDAGVVCAQVYGTVESNIALGSEFTSGETYRVFVNGKQYEEFVAQ
jgi:hypothetical protein